MKLDQGVVHTLGEVARASPGPKTMFFGFKRSCLTSSNDLSRARRRIPRVSKFGHHDLGMVCRLCKTPGKIVMPTQCGTNSTQSLFTPNSTHYLAVKCCRNCVLHDRSAIHQQIITSPSVPEPLQPMPQQPLHTHTMIDTLLHQLHNCVPPKPHRYALFRSLFPLP